MVLPKPDYDSGWQPADVPLPPTQPTPDYGPDLVLHHNLGTTEVLVSLVFQNLASMLPHAITETGIYHEDWWLTDNDIRITKRPFTTHPLRNVCRVRMWKISP